MAGISLSPFIREELGSESCPLPHTATQTPALKVHTARARRQPPFGAARPEQGRGGPRTCAADPQLEAVRTRDTVIPRALRLQPPGCTGHGDLCSALFKPANRSLRGARRGPFKCGAEARWLGGRSRLRVRCRVWARAGGRGGPVCPEDLAAVGTNQSCHVRPEGWGFRCPVRGVRAWLGPAPPREPQGWGRLRRVPSCAVPRPCPAVGASLGPGAGGLGSEPCSPRASSLQ